MLFSVGLDYKIFGRNWVSTCCAVDVCIDSYVLGGRMGKLHSKCDFWLLPTCWGGASGGVGEHVGRGGLCFTMNVWRFPMDLDGFLACGFPLIFLLSTKHFQNGFGWISCMWNYTFWQILHVSGLEMTFWSNFRMVLHGFASRNPKNTVLRPKTLKYYQKPKNKTPNLTYSRNISG